METTQQKNERGLLRFKMDVEQLAALHIASVAPKTVVSLKELHNTAFNSVEAVERIENFSKEIFDSLLSLRPLLKSETHPEGVSEIICFGKYWEGNILGEPAINICGFNVESMELMVSNTMREDYVYEYFIPLSEATPFELAQLLLKVLEHSYYSKKMSENMFEKYAV